MTAAYRLSQAGVDVTLYERAPDLGGLVGSFDFDGTQADRFYHVVLPTDDRVLGLAGELGLRDTFRFRPTKVGFYGGGRVFSATSPKDFLTFPLLKPFERARLAAFVVRCQMIKTPEELDETPLVPWLERLCGKGVVEKMWKPLLDSKFDGVYDDLPATYIWSRTRRMGGTRDRSGQEVLGWMEGGYQKLIDSLGDRIRQLGGDLRVRAQVDQIVGSNGRVTGLVVDGAFRPFDHVLCTLAPPHGASTSLARARRPGAGRPLPLPRRRLSAPADIPERQPLLPPEHHRSAGRLDDDRRDHPRGRSRGRRRAPALRLEVRRDGPCRPGASPGRARARLSDAREGHFPRPARRGDRLEGRAAGPAHGARASCRRRQAPPRHVPDDGLSMASTAHVYPEIVSGQAVIGVSEHVIPGILERLPEARRAAA